LEAARKFKRFADIIASHKFGEPPQVLCDCCERELELRAARPSQAQSIKLLGFAPTLYVRPR
jgi:hypothetical protein